mgnify:CR=1 FL=1
MRHIYIDTHAQRALRSQNMVAIKFLSFLLLSIALFSYGCNSGSGYSSGSGSVHPNTATIDDITSDVDYRKESLQREKMYNNILNKDKKKIQYYDKDGRKAGSAIIE